MEHIETKNSPEFKLQTDFICSIRIFNILPVICTFCYHYDGSACDWVRQMFASPFDIDKCYAHRRSFVRMASYRPVQTRLHLDRAPGTRLTHFAHLDLL